MTDHVELTLPARPDLLVLARMTVGAVAARADMAVDDIEDLRLAIDELCITLLNAGVCAGQIALLFQWDSDGTLDVVGTLVPDGDPSGNGHAPAQTGPALSVELSQRILDSLVDDHGSDAIGGVHRAWLRVRRQELSV